MSETTQDTVQSTLHHLVGTVDELEPILQSIVVNDTTILDALSQMLGVLHHMQARSEQSQARVADEVRDLRQSIAALKEHLAAGTAATVLAADQDPEIGLLEYLYSFLETPIAIDVGANVGRVSERLLQAGYTVYAFEPYPPAFETMQQKLSGQPRFQARPWAIGAADGNMALHVAADLSAVGKWDPTLFNSLVPHPMLEDCDFRETVPVTVRSLTSLREAGEIPPSAGLLKIDTEGFDAEVIRGMGEGHHAVVMAEFWDAEHPFGRAGHGRLADLVGLMKARGYAWHVVIYHVDETATISWYCNRVQSVPKSWGNVLFFRTHDLFMRALRWCEDALTATLHR